MNIFLCLLHKQMRYLQGKQNKNLEKKKKRKQQWKAAYQQQKEEKSIEELIIKGTNWGQQAHPLISLHQQSNQQIKVQIMKTLRLQY